MATEDITATPNELRDAVHTMDGLSQEAFGHIESLAKSCLLILERPDREKYLSDEIWRMLEMISARAFDGMNYINSEAERVGANYKDDTLDRRYPGREGANNG